MSLQSRYDELIRTTVYDSMTFNLANYSKLLPLISYTMDATVLSIKEVNGIVKKYNIKEDKCKIYVFIQNLWKLLNNKLNIDNIYKIEHNKDHIYDLVLEEYNNILLIIKEKKLKQMEDIERKIEKYLTTLN